MSNRIKVQCNECWKKWKTASLSPQCSRCNGVDVEVVEEFAEAPARAAERTAEQKKEDITIQGILQAIHDGGSDREDYGGAFDGIRVTSDVDGGM